MRSATLLPAVLLVFAAPPAEATTPPMRVHFLDVGQGDATLFEFPCGAVLVDTGGEQSQDFDGSGALVSYLDAFFERRTDLNNSLDLLAITHPHIDHTGAIEEIVARYSVENIVYNGQFPRDKGGKPQRFLRKWARKNNVPAQSVAFNTMWNAQATTSPIIDPIECDDVDPEITVLWGRIREDPGWGSSYGKKRFRNPNNHSLVLHVQYGSSEVLLTGDLEEKAIGSFLDRYQGNELLTVEVYQVGHHGSRNGTTQELVDAMAEDDSLKAAVISMGAPCRRGDWTAWDHGHPNRSVVKQLADSVRLTRSATVAVFDGQEQDPQNLSLEKAVYGTGWDGTVVVEARTDGWIEISTLGQHACP